MCDMSSLKAKILRDAHVLFREDKGSIRVLVMQDTNTAYTLLPNAIRFTSAARAPETSNQYSTGGAGSSSQPVGPVAVLNGAVLEERTGGNAAPKRELEDEEEGGYPDGASAPSRPFAPRAVHADDASEQAWLLQYSDGRKRHFDEQAGPAPKRSAPPSPAAGD